MPANSIEIVRTLLEGAADPEVVDRLMAEDSIYVSLACDAPGVKISMAWDDTHRDGRECIVDTFRALNTFWTIDDFCIRDIFGDDENVAAFGSFTASSGALNEIFVSPFAVQAKLKDGLVTYLLYMENSLATRPTLRDSEIWSLADDSSRARAAVRE